MGDTLHVTSDMFRLNRPSAESTARRGLRWSGVSWFFLSLVTCCLSLPGVFAGERPSLFRGVVIADSPVGVRVVSVEEGSQAGLADLRPEDIIIRVQAEEVQSIDAFAVLSNALKGRANVATVVIFRHGAPRELTLHLYSYPILRVWGIEFIPDYDLRFAQPAIGLEYWKRMGRGFDGAQKPEEALNAYLNGLHLVPTDTDAAFRAALLASRISQQRFRDHQPADGIPALRHSITLMEKLFDAPLSDAQLQLIKSELQATVTALHAASSSIRSGAASP